MLLLLIDQQFEAVEIAVWKCKLSFDSLKQLNPLKNQFPSFIETISCCHLNLSIKILKKNLTFSGECIKCFQCSSTEDQRKPTGVWSEDHYTQNRYEDNCGVYWPFIPERNVAVECNSDESHTPGTFCVKITRQGPRGFICKI